jgi:cell division protein FtsB
VTADSDLGGRLDSLGQQIGYGRGLRPTRTQIVAVLLAIVAFWLLITFGRALGQLNDATQREAAAAAETRSLQAQLEAGRRELTLVQTDAFQAIQARALGMGGPGEKVFALAADAPAPPAIAPLGRNDSSAATKSPLDAWLELLFGN